MYRGSCKGDRERKIQDSQEKLRETFVLETKRPVLFFFFLRDPFFWQIFFELLLCLRCWDKSVNSADKLICCWGEIDKNIIISKFYILLKDENTTKYNKARETESAGVSAVV